MFPGKSLITTDTLSRAPVSSSTHSDSAHQAEITAFMSLVTDTLPTFNERLKEIHFHQVQGKLCGVIADLLARLTSIIVVTQTILDLPCKFQQWPGWFTFVQSVNHCSRHTACLNPRATTH